MSTTIVESMAPNLSKATADVVGDVAVDGLKPSSRFTLKGNDLAVDGHPALLDVPANIRLTPASTLVSASDVAEAGDGCFLGFDAPAPDSRHVVPIGRLVDTKFMSIFRFKAIDAGASEPDKEIPEEELDEAVAEAGGPDAIATRGARRRWKQ